MWQTIISILCFWVLAAGVARAEITTQTLLRSKLAIGGEKLVLPSGIVIPATAELREKFVRVHAQSGKGTEGAFASETGMAYEAAPTPAPTAVPVAESGLTHADILYTTHSKLDLYFLKDNAKAAATPAPGSAGMNVPRQPANPNAGAFKPSSSSNGGKSSSHSGSRSSSHSSSSSSSRSRSKPH